MQRERHLQGKSRAGSGNAACVRGSDRAAGPVKHTARKGGQNAGSEQCVVARGSNCA